MARYTLSEKRIGRSHPMSGQWTAATCDNGERELCVQSYFEVAPLEVRETVDPVPEAPRPEQNRHRAGDGRQAPTVSAILQNPRYTGYGVFGRWSKVEELSDPDDVAAGHVVRFRRSRAGRIVRSRRPAHPKIVSVEAFTEAHLIRRAKAGTSNRSRSQLERARQTTLPRPYHPTDRCTDGRRGQQADRLAGRHVSGPQRGRTRGQDRALHGAQR
ncbi:recombinase family protein [Nocardia sp. NBC_00403]|uniref:recombinase family protein n=1 Tax=Nocardia sp. NBC_00403 TaxID=2975990 RepID=UPI003FA5EDE3